MRQWTTRRFPIVMKPFLIILAGHAPEPIRDRLGDFQDWFARALGLPAEDLRVVDAEAGETVPAASDVRAAVISGSATMVTDREPWSERLADWIRAALDAQLPLFGVCYGHQLMAHALGGRAGPLPGGREIGTVDIAVLEAGRHDPLLQDLPARFPAQSTHEQSVLDVPAGVQVLARSARDPHQILRYGPHAVSTQLHPEFDADAMTAYLRLRADALRAESMDPDALLAAVRPAPDAMRLLHDFARHVSPGPTDAAGPAA